MEKNLDVTNPPFNEQIWPVPSDFVKSRFHCIQYLRNPVSMSMSVFGAKLVVKWPITPKIDYGPIFRLYPQLTPNFSRLKERI